MEKIVRLIWSDYDRTMYAYCVQLNRVYTVVRNIKTHSKIFKAIQAPKPISTHITMFLWKFRFIGSEHFIWLVHCCCWNFKIRVPSITVLMFRVPNGHLPIKTDVFIFSVIFIIKILTTMYEEWMFSSV